MTKQYTADSGLAYLTGQLSFIEKKVFEVKYTKINYVDVVPVSNEAGEYATSITYFSLDGRTNAKFIGSNAIDIPIAEISIDRTVIPVEFGATGYQYSNEEMRQATQLQLPLSSHKASLARRGYEELVQRVCMTGDTTHNLPGFVNNSEVTAANVVDPGAGTEWVNKTPRQILFDINDMFSDILVDSLQNEQGNTLALPTAQWSYISGTPRSDQSDLTILKWLVNNSPYLNSESDVIPLNELTGAGAGSTDRMIAYTKDSDKVIFHLPLSLRFLAPQLRDLGYRVPAEFKISGVNFRYPGSARYGDGI